MAVDGFTCLILYGGRASIVVQNRVERRRVPGRWNATEDGDVCRAWVIGQRNPRWQWDGDADRCVRLDPRRASIVVERVKGQERVVGVSLFDDPLNVQDAEGPRALAVAGEARTPITAERLLIEELLAIELRAKLILTERL